MPQTYQSCKPYMTPARLWIGRAPTSLGTDCNDYYGYTLSSNYINTDTLFTMSATQTDYTTIVKASSIVNLGYFTKNGEVVMAHDKTLNTTYLDTVDLIRGVSKLKDKICSCGTDTTFAETQSASTNDLRFTGEWIDFTLDDPDTGWFSVDTLDAVDVGIATEYDEPGTHQQGTMDLITGQTKITVKAKLPLNIDPKYIRYVSGGNPIVTDNAAALASDKRFQALFTNMSGKGVCHIGLVVVPETTAQDCNNYDLDENLKFNGLWFIPRCAAKLNTTFTLNKGTQMVYEVEFTVLFDPYFQALMFNSPLTHTDTHYPTLIP